MVLGFLSRRFLQAQRYFAAAQRGFSVFGADIQRAVVADAHGRARKPLPALLERDGRLMLLNWIGGVVAIAFFGISSGQLLTYLTQLGNSLLS